MTHLKPATYPEYRNFDGKYVRISQLNLDDLDDFYQKIHGTQEKEAVWRYLPYGPFATVDRMKSFYQTYLDAKDKVIYSVHAIKNNALVGITCLEDINPQMATVEVASVLYCPEAQKSEANTETVYTLMAYCFEDLGYRRISWRCNYHNHASKRSALRLGFEFEGIFYNHMIAKNENRDTAWFGLIDQRWPMVKENIQQWLDQDNPSERASLFKQNSRVPCYSMISMKESALTK